MSMLMSITREECLERAITAAKAAETEMNGIAEGDSEVDSGVQIVRGWVDIADTWVDIAKELPGLPRPNPTVNVQQVAHNFPEGVPTISHAAV